MFTSFWRSQKFLPEMLLMHWPQSARLSMRLQPLFALGQSRDDATIFPYLRYDGPWLHAHEQITIAVQFQFSSIQVNASVVTIDPQNEDHLLAYSMCINTCFGRGSKQLPKRFAQPESLPKNSRNFVSFLSSLFWEFTLYYEELIIFSSIITPL